MRPVAVELAEVSAVDRDRAVRHHELPGEVDLAVMLVDPAGRDDLCARVALVEIGDMRVQRGASRRNDPHRVLIDAVVAPDLVEDRSTDDLVFLVPCAAIGAHSFVERHRSLPFAVRSSKWPPAARTLSCGSRVVTAAGRSLRRIGEGEDADQRDDQRPERDIDEADRAQRGEGVGAFLQARD